MNELQSIQNDSSEVPDKYFYYTIFFLHFDLNVLFVQLKPSLTFLRLQTETKDLQNKCLVSQKSASMCKYLTL